MPTDPAAPLATNPDGTPYFPAAGVIAAGGPTTIWNIPKSITGEQLWFDVGHRRTNEQTLDMRTGRESNIHSATSHEIMASPQKIMAQFAAMSKNDPAGYLAIQQALAAGVWGKVNVNGAFDTTTENAIANAMVQYVKLSKGAGVGISFKDYLISTASSASALQQEQAQATAPPIQVTDPESIRQNALQAAQEALGENIGEKQLNAFVEKFQAKQVSAQQAGPGQQFSMPDLGAEAMSYVQGANPQEFKNNQRTAYLDQLVNLLGGSLTSRPNQQPVPTVGGGK
jgi:hypothetical protein